MTPIGSHLAHDRRLRRSERLYLRAFGTPDPALRARTAHVLRALKRLRPAVVLDTGCGAGFTTITAAARLPWLRMTGIDSQGEQIELAKELATAAGVANASFECADVFAYAPDGRVDAVVCADALEYFEDDAAYLHRVRRWLEPGAALILHCRQTPTPRILRAFRGSDPHADGRLRSGYDPGSLSILLTDAGFELTRVRQTLQATAELAHELADPDLGPIRGRTWNALAGPGLAALASADVFPTGRGAGLLAIARAR
jgi:cyclopropane fatty-acyl-phospholipid synthase-like methyltransferase